MKLVQISKGLPKKPIRKPDIKCPALYPSWAMIKKTDQEQYQRQYDEILKKADADGVIRELVEMSKTDNLVLCCWERKRQDCHRRYVAVFIKEHFGVDVPEWIAKENPEGLFN